MLKFNFSLKLIEKIIQINSLKLMSTYNFYIYHEKYFIEINTGLHTKLVT